MKKKISLTKQYVLEAITSLLILLFVYAALSKAVDYKMFRVSLLESPIIGRGTFSRDMVSIFGIIIIITELFVALLLFIPRTRLWGLIGSLILMTLFSLYIGYILLFSKDIPCSCGGVIAYLTWNQHLVFNIFFTLLSFTGIILQKKQMPISQSKFEGAVS